MDQHQPSRRRTLTTFALVMITIGSVDSIRNLPATALFGSALIFFFILAAVCFLIPCALVSGELASSRDDHGGVYDWVKQAFGQEFGFMAIWFQWIENVMWYPTILSFVAGTIGYLINPALAQNKYFLVAIILSAFWGTTFINLLGIKSSARFSNLCGILGLLLPMTLIIGLGAMWCLRGMPMQIQLTTQSLLPNLENSNLWVSLTGIILSFCGMEIATVHAVDVKNPKRAFPRAMLYSTLIIVSTLMFGSLAIAIVLPAQKISLVAGIMQAYHAFFAAYHLNAILPFAGLALILGGLGSVSNWIIAPTRGLLIAVRDTRLPSALQTENRHGAPRFLLITQAIIVSLFTSAFLFMPTVNGSYWLLTALAAQLYMLMYILMFAACIKLRFTGDTKQAAFKIPGGKLGVCLVAGIGIISAFVTICVGFIPPHTIKVGNVNHYDLYIIVGLFLMCAPPFLASYFNKPSQYTETVTDTNAI